jgi:primosomal protein N''
MDNEILDLLKTINNKLDEHTQILRALEHASEVHKSELDKVNYAVARLEGEVKGIREDLTAVEMITSKNWNDISKLKAVK